jgi:GxxExxY protein
MSQGEFGDIAYEVLKHAFSIHGQIGRLFDEKIYRRALHRSLGRQAEVEFPVSVWHGDFRTCYFLDLVVDGGALFELKTVESLTDRHRSQVINYLMLTDTHHAKLINFRPSSVEHEFVNTMTTTEIRRQVSVDTEGWNRALDGSRLWEEMLMELLRDWGSGLALSLYEDALVHLLGGEEKVVRAVEIAIGGAPCGQVDLRLLNPTTAFWVSGVRESDRDMFEVHLWRFLQHSSLSHLQWANITLGKLSLRTLSKT